MLTMWEEFHWYFGFQIDNFWIISLAYPVWIRFYLGPFHRVAFPAAIITGHIERVKCYSRILCQKLP